MIPTTVTSSPTTATASSSGCSNNMSGSASGSSINGQMNQSPSTLIIGIASLVLEGRAIAEDDFHQVPPAQQTQSQFQQQQNPVHQFLPLAQAVRSGAVSDIDMLSFLGNSSGSSGATANIAATHLNSGHTGERHSPRPSTSRAAAMHATSSRVINITANPHPGGSSSPFIDAYSSSSASSSAESTHQRWTQKLCQLRQASPASSLSYEQKVSVEALSAAGEPELVALRMNDDRNGDQAGDFEIVRRVGINRPGAAGGGGGSGMSSSPGSLHSLQSLASIRLCGGNPCAETASSLTGRGYSGITTSPLSTPPNIGGIACRGQSAGAGASMSRFNYWATSTSTPRFQNPYAMDVLSSGGSTGSGVQSPRTPWYTPSPLNGNISGGSRALPSSTEFAGSAFPNPARPLVDRSAMKENYTPSKSGRVPIPPAALSGSRSPGVAIPCNTAKGATASAANPTLSNMMGASAAAKGSSGSGSVNGNSNSTTGSTTKSASSTYPQQGPHCDQFLRKMGLAKGESAEAEEHFCDMSYVNITCSRWRAYCLKMEAIIKRGEPVCIEVYLGPVNDKVLLEQWIITQKERVPPPVMTMPSLCSAIRSQLYFSQVSAWCDLIKKNDPSIYDHRRIIYPNATGAAGDLAGCNSQTPPPSVGTSPTGLGTSPLSHHQPTTSSRPRLNIFYRIKQHDATACFNSKPIVHNFPSVNVSENSSISVCLKSLPRTNGAIPRISTAMQPIGDGVSTGGSGQPMNGNSRSSALGTPQNHRNQQENQRAAQRESHNRPMKLHGMANGQKVKNGNSVLIDGIEYSTPPDTPQSSRTMLTTPSGSECGFASAATSDTHLSYTAVRVTDDEVASISSSKSSTSTNSGSGIDCKNSNNNNDDATDAPMPSSSTRALGGDTMNGGRSGSGTGNGSGDIATIKEQPLGDGGHKCKFFIDEDELLTEDPDDVDGDCDDVVSDSNTNGSMGDCAYNGNSNSNGSANLTHREKQLLRYRKRMLKRDKKQRKVTDLGQTSSKTSFHNNNNNYNNKNTNDRNVPITGNKDSSQDPQMPQQQQNHQQQQHQPMEQGDEEAPPRTLSFKKSTTKRTSTQIEMISTGTQTPMVSCCRQCGTEKTLACLKCDTVRDHDLLRADNGVESDEMDESVTSLSSGEIIRTPRNKAELLLQAIQRTPKASKSRTKLATERSSSSALMVAAMPKLLQNNNHLLSAAGGICNAGGTAMSEGSGGTLGGCQVCKRQKTAHNFSDEDKDNEEDDNDTDGGRTRNGIDFKDSSSLNETEDRKSDEETMEEEIFHTSTTLTPNLERCTLSNSSNFTLIQIRVAKPNSIDGTDASSMLHEQPGKLTVDCSNGIVGIATDGTHPFKTPKQQQSLRRNKPNLLQVSNDYQHRLGVEHDGSPPCYSMSTGGMTAAPSSSLKMRKNLPKVNLTPIFCNPSAVLTSSHSSPIPISSSSADDSYPFDAVPPGPLDTLTVPTSAGHQHQHHQHQLSINATTAVDNNNIPVQKSYSAPTLPNSPSLSPRFAKQAAIYKRRSRHLSDRSDRSSLGSDEQFSDDDVENSGSTMYSPATSPLKSRLRMSASFGRQPLLGNLEESLFHKRLVPKVEVAGFKVLLGASGGFCPTQLTIPASAYFYELHGDTLSTPYMCEIRLPRRGYSIPRAGTVQATLLNPMGTVVRMFVIPYDMRDMPPMHQTFIRQRILAEGSTQNETVTTEQGVMHNNNNNNNNNDNDSNNKNNINMSESSIHTCTTTSSSYSGSTGSFDSESGNLLDSFHEDSAQSSSANCNGNSSTHHSSTAYRLPIGSSSSQQGGSDNSLGHFISVEHMKRLRYSIHLRFQTSRNGRLSLHTDIRLLISRRTDCDTAAAHAKGVLEAPNDLITYTVMPANPKYSARQDATNKI